MTNKSIEGVSTIACGLDNIKQSTEPWLDKALFIGGLNGAGTLALMEVIQNSDFSEPATALTSAAYGAATMLVNGAAYGSQRLRGTMGWINTYLDKTRPVSWAKSGILTAGAIGVLLGLYPHAKQIATDDLGMFVEEQVVATEIPTSLEKRLEQAAVEDIKPVAVASDKPKVNKLGKVKPSRNRPEIYDLLSYDSDLGIEHDFSGTSIVNKNTNIGRIQRTLRWQPIYRAIEEKYDLPQDILAGMIMEESYGNPVQPNATGDGGLGVVHVQGTTAEMWGLNIYGNSNSAHDPKHGKEIKTMLNSCSFDLACVQKYDERAHLIKVLDTAARIVSTGSYVHRNTPVRDPTGVIEDDLQNPVVWGVEYYRAPGKVGKQTTWRYFERVQRWRNKIRDPNLLEAAAADFEERNSGITFDEYLGQWHEMAPNWGLETYTSLQ